MSLDVWVAQLRERKITTDSDGEWGSGAELARESRGRDNGAVEAMR